jgi:hypothetical protein
LQIADRLEFIADSLSIVQFNRHSAIRILQYHCFVPMETPKFRPLERFWPYADIPEQPTDEERAALDPDLHDALFGPTERPFSITLVFPRLDRPDFPRALDAARGAAELREAGGRFRARFRVTDARRLREVFQIVGDSPETEVLIDDRPVPYARQLWLPLVWFLIAP